MAEARREGWSDWIRSENDERAVLNGCRFVEARGQHIVDFFSRFLVHSKLRRFAGKPFVPLGFQRDDILMPLFGWLRDNGLRRYNRGYISMAKKNAKSTLGGGISMYMLTADGEPGARCYSAAADREQAAIVFDAASGIIGPQLAKRLRVLPATKRIVYQAKGSFYRALTGESRRNDGWDIYSLMFDELHAQINRELWDTLCYGDSARQNSMILSLTTAGYDTNSICYEQYQYAKNLIDPKVDMWDDGFFTYIAEVEKEADWEDPAEWRKANPAYGVIIEPDKFEAAFLEAKQSPAKENSFRRLKLNQWTSQAVRFITMSDWDACAGPVRDLEGRSCWGAIDLASTTDTAALVLVFPDDDGTFDVHYEGFIPEDGARERGKADRVPYERWVEEGLLTATEGNRIHYDAILLRLDEIREEYDLRELAFDTWNATYVQQILDGKAFPVSSFIQGYKSFNSPTKELEKLLASGKIRHGGHPVLRWMAENLAVMTDPAANVKPAKDKSYGRIDGMVALIMALGRATVGEGGPSCYETDGDEAI